MRNDSSMNGRNRRGERGAALVEFTIAAFVFLTAIFGVLEFSRLLWTHNALSDAARRGARFAVNQTNPADAITEARPVGPDAVRNMVIYGNEEGAGNPVVSGLELADVAVEYADSPVTNYFSYPKGTVSVGITNFQFRFVLPLVGTTLTLPDYRTTLTAESAGLVPPDILPSPTPTPEPTPTPAPTPGPTPTPAPTPTPSPTPSPTPRTCRRGENVSTGCVCRPPLKVNGSGKCQ